MARRLVRRFGAAPPDVDDLAQETLLTLHANLTRFDPHTPLSAAARGIARRVVTAHYRKARRRRPLDAVRFEDEPVAPAQEQELSARRALSAVLARARALPPTKRRVFQLVVIEGRSVEEAARVLGCRHKTVHSHLYAALHELLQVVNDESTTSEPGLV